MQAEAFPALSASWMQLVRTAKSQCAWLCSPLPDCDLGQLLEGVGKEVNDVAHLLMVLKRQCKEHSWFEV